MDTIDTTVCIHPDRLSRLEQNAEKLGIKVNDLVVALFNAAMSRNKEIGTPTGTLSYQETTGEYLTMHIYLTPKDYDQKIDMRRVYKMSASLVLAMSIDWFLEDLVEHWFDADQSNSIINEFFPKKHQLIPKFNKKFTEYRIIWGFPPS